MCRTPRLPVRFFLTLSLLGLFAAPIPGGGPTPEKILIVSFDPVQKTTRVGVMNADGSGQTFLTDGKAPALDPVWSRDRRKIAYILADRKQKSGDLYVMNADGTGQKRLTQSPANTVVHAPSWAPDGKRIVFTRRQFGAAAKPGPPELFAMDADGKGEQRLGSAPAMLPDWSPDGRLILFAAPDPTNKLDSRLFVIAPDGKNLRPVTTGKAILGAWSPDGRQIAYMGTDMEKPAFFVMNADGSGTRVVRHAQLGMEIGPQWSADGKRLYFSGARVGKTIEIAVYAMDADGKNVRRLTDPKGATFLGGGVGMFIPVESNMQGGGQVKEGPIPKKG